MNVTNSELLAAAAVGVSIVSLVLKLHRENMKMNTDAAAERAEIRVKVDALWQFQLDRAKMAAEHKGLGQTNSPFAITDETRRKVPTSLVVALHAFYKLLPATVQASDIELAVRIQKDFARQLVDDICKPQGIIDGECLLIAMDIARSAA